MRRTLERAAAAGMLAAALLPFSLAAASAAEPQASGGGRLDWGACPDGDAGTGMECAELRVPVDPERPRGRHITLMLARLPATGPGGAEGSVLINPGGPGASGITYLRDYFAEPMSGLREHMDLVTWDTRGYPGLSDELPCDMYELVLPRTPAYPADQAGLDRLAAENRERAAACRDRDPVLFDHMDSASHAHDMEAIRRALGERRLNYYGASYGGIFGQAYARLFPDRIRTMVLDGTGNHSTGDWEAELDAIARDNESALQRFFDWCAADASCAMHGRDAEAEWRALVAAADIEPIPAPARDVSLTGRELQALEQSIQGPAAWPALGEALRLAVDEGDASGFARPQGNPYPMIGTPGLTECLEYPYYDDHEELAATVERIERIAPNNGASFPLIAHASTACAGWPAPVSNPPAPLPDEVPPLLGAGTWLDFAGTERVVDQVPGSRTVYHDGPGHVLYGMGNECAIEHIDRYLVTGRLPAADTEC
ncbi:alpha/beta fold hydrolase [Allonocardiopsis opalescens]|uniref:TAP-like protein n=1 Tax=Allonocardiopsis opalescens TaxID=1144618 RepID=A0A2T0Q5E8_9ACTN|nr:alpha/beta fold hydrolase [Allonocardiopsis opalescens]PRX99014.1 TAP-like protein [Allonocardiopsis opalescens]